MVKQICRPPKWSSRRVLGFSLSLVLLYIVTFMDSKKESHLHCEVTQEEEEDLALVEAFVATSVES